MKVYVLDASVAVRFLLAEDLSEKAELVLRGLFEGEAGFAIAGTARL